MIPLTGMQCSPRDATVASDRDPDFERLIQRVRDGSQEAAWELIQNFASQILRVVRRRLPDNMRSKFDSQDFVQAVWASVFAHPSRLQGCNESSEFVAYLGGIAANKVKMEVRRRIYAQKNDIRRERPLDDSTGGLVATLPATEATPSACAMARERWSQLLAGQPEHYQEIIKLRYAGMNLRDIAEKLNLHEGTVQRVIRNMLHQLR